MKTTYGRLGIFTFALALLSLSFGFQFRKLNNHLRQTTGNFEQAIEQEKCLQDQNVTLKKRWNYNKDILSELSKYLICPSNEISNNSIEVYDPELQHNISVHENYVTGFIAHDDYVKALEKLCDAQLPILITFLSIHRSIAHNYALKIYINYRTK